jgi:hypothetical protein
VARKRSEAEHAMPLALVVRCFIHCYRGVEPAASAALRDINTAERAILDQDPEFLRVERRLVRRFTTEECTRRQVDSCERLHLRSPIAALTDQVLGDDLADDEHDLAERLAVYAVSSGLLTHEEAYTYEA